MAFKFGGTIVLERSMAYPFVLIQKLVDEKVTGFPIVPTVLSILLKLDLSKYDLSNLRYVSNTGAALPVTHIRKLRELFPKVRIYSMYGLTECKRVSYLAPELVDERPDDEHAHTRLGQRRHVGVGDGVDQVPAHLEKLVLLARVLDELDRLGDVADELVAPHPGVPQLLHQVHGRPSLLGHGS